VILTFFPIIIVTNYVTKRLEPAFSRVSPSSPTFAILLSMLAISEVYWIVAQIFSCDGFGRDEMKGDEISLDASMSPLSVEF
jgi:hypothetical protein